MATQDRCGSYNGRRAMSLERKLARWRDAGLIDDATRTRIEAFESAQRKPIVLYALAVLGGGTVALGVVSVVAANWQRIPAAAKLGADLVLGALLAAATYASVQREQPLRREVLVTVFYGFTLASLALVGQVYQLDTPTYQALLAWTAATLPLVLLGHSRYLAALIAVSLATTHGFCLEALIDHVEHSGRMSEATERNLIALAAFVSPLVYVPLGRVPWLLRNRPEYARTLSALAWSAVLAAGFGLQFAWYERIDANDTLSWAPLAAAAAAGALGAALSRLQPELPAPARRTVLVILGFAWLTFALATTFVRGPADWLGALLQIAWLALFSWCSLQLGMLRAFNTLTALIAVRVLVVYFEVFGSLLDTGLGLITGGALTLLIAWFWRRKTKDLSERIGPNARSGHGA
jgi:uncharacterized membrane protein